MQILKKSIRVFIGLLYIFIAIINLQCEKEEQFPKKNSSNRYFETVSFSELSDYFNNEKELLNKNVYVQFDYNDVMYEPLVNSEAKLAVIPAKTKWDSIHSRVLLLKVNDSIKAIVFNMFSRLNQTDSSNFTGEITIRGLNGSIIAGYRVIDGNIDIQYLPSVLNVTANKSILKSDSANAECRSFCGHQASDPNCICNIQYLDPVVVTAPSSNPMPVITA